jgi:protein arginine N-methyltransferase 3
MQEDALLYSFNEDDEHEDNFTISAEEEELIRKIDSFENICIDDDSNTDYLPDNNTGKEKSSEKAKTHGGDHMIISPVMVAESKIQNTNKNYFGSYSSFGIHREMLSDKVRTDAYRKAIVENPSLIKGATVLDVGCGTGILSLFAAQAGASRVIAVEASEKMAAVATQIAKDNGHLRNGTSKEGSYNDNEGNGVIEVVNGMVEEIVELKKPIEPQSVDVLVSEWMGYCLLYESMLDSVIIARDTWLKPCGAILPDTATMFVAGFGKGATSMPFWENVYGFSMKSVGKELVKDAANAPIVDVIDSTDVITNSAVLQMFDLATMKAEDVEFTSSISLELNSTESKRKTDYCYGVVLWFDTNFTSRFCKDAPAVLSTSPYTPKTHWSQTLLTLRDPIALTARQNDDGNFVKYGGGEVGTDECPAMRIDSRISISRAPQHRSIDISLELTAVSVDGQRRKWPVQIYNLY